MSVKTSTKIILKIDEVSQSGKGVNKAIAMYLISLFKKKGKLPKISSFSNRLHISTSAISKFVKSIGVESYSVLRYLYSENAAPDDPVELVKGEVVDNTEILNITTNLVKESRRVLLVADGATLDSIKVFSTFLLKKGYEVIWTESVSTQKFISEQLRRDDLILCFAFGSTPVIIQKILINTYAKRVLFTTKDLEEYPADVVWKYDDQSVEKYYSEFPFEILIKVQYDLKNIIESLEYKK